MWNRSDTKDGVQRRDLGERRARVAEKQAKVLKEEKDSRPFPNNKRKAGSGKIIIGAILDNNSGCCDNYTWVSKVNSRNECRRLLDRDRIYQSNSIGFIR